MTLLDAPAYNARKARLIRNISITTFIVIVVLGVSGFLLRHWPAEHRLNTFFAAVESQDMKKAYGIWNHDPDWEQHPQQYKDYSFATFSKDWGPASDYGIIRSHTILMTASVGNGTVMGVDINGGKTPIFLRVDNKTKTVGFSPVELYTGP
ncbi:hypothetical protein [Silvibacterium dinghuense]|uniref:Uncharacterized protein n=1 Tax=Silvibacterium dinghuense TaxID=1560006 RepID=A0A4Q1S9R8_9BACT|nr:hypothetical protein [Silvibacterium dinghuense]RXS93806.1 hypothetical protein ESZ00_17340 [Silvibacterium dinghuense]GGH07813.1 hypothetical protein GCM10011586_25140 [Silvibacterium dinghuense]